MLAVPRGAAVITGVRMVWTNDRLVHAQRQGRAVVDTRVIVCRPYDRVMVAAAPLPVTCLWCAAEKVRFW